MNLLGLYNQCTPMLQFARQWVLKVFFELQHLMLFICQCGNSYLELAHDIAEAANFATYSLGAQLQNQHHTSTFQHWQHGHMISVSLRNGKTNSLTSLSLHMLKQVLICH